jgi:hypothetical protein
MLVKGDCNHFFAIISRQGTRAAFTILHATNRS